MFRLDLNLEGVLQRAGEPMDAAQWEITDNDDVNGILDLNRRQMEMINAWKKEGTSRGPTLNTELRVFHEKFFKKQLIAWLLTNLPPSEKTEKLKEGIFELVLNGIENQNGDQSFMVSGLVAANGVLLTVSQSSRDFDPYSYILEKERGWFYYDEEGNPMKAGKGFQNFYECNNFYVFFDTSGEVYLTGIYIPFSIKDELSELYEKERVICYKSDKIYGEVAAAVGYEFADKRFNSLAIETIAEIRRLVTEKRPDLLERFEKVVKNITSHRHYEKGLYCDPTFLYEEV